MAQQLQVNLSFTANSAKAKAQIQDLQNSLNNLMKNTRTSTSDNIMTQFNEETIAANKNVAQLQAALKTATNQSTGKLDLSKFNASLKNSGLSLNQVKDSLIALGPEGEKAFIKVAQSIMQADTQIKISNKLVNDLWISLKNTAKWQLSSSIVKGFMSAISTAFNYAEDLNKSLNQIQIVTGNSAEQMARFAKQANIAAKELSTTTTAYTDASLIYYQQGLDDANVKARTDITIKAANAAGTNAEEMADYLTAVWNSYKVGSDELERYVDVMAALGAGTATSLEEISTAMEKVASVGEATGVKFEQMSSIIATVSSVTRQSAETVGTAFKTIFARMADLKLEGSIEEDGVTTTLGTVSKQLAQVGVNILDANGELRNMGDVTEELMGKWNTMNDATKQAIAIAVAGKRQYTQLLALMNNQDLYRESMAMATGAEGTLQEQADTYAKSWEAAQKRVKAAAQGIYDSLINDKFFIDLNDGLAVFLGTLENLIDHMGGFKGVLLQIGTIFGNIFSKEISAGISSAANQLKMFTSKGRNSLNEEAQRMRTQSQRMITDVLVNSSTFNSSTGIVEADSIQRQNKLYGLYIDNAKNMNEEQRKTVQYLLDQQNILEQNVLKYAKTAEEAKKIEESQAKSVLSNLTSNKKGENNLYDRYSKRSAESANATMLSSRISSIKGNSTSIKQLQNYVNSLQKTMGDLDKNFGREVAEKLDLLSQKLKTLGKNSNLDKVEKELKDLLLACQEDIESFEKLDQLINEAGSEAIEELALQSAPPDEQADYEDAAEQIHQYTNQIKENSQAQAENIDIQTSATQSAENLTGEINNLSIQTPSITQGFVVLGNVLMTTFSSINSLMAIFSTLTDPELTGLEKLQTILMNLPVIFMTITSLMQLFNAENKAMTINSLAAALGIKVKTAASEADTTATVAETIAVLGLKGALDALTFSNPILLAITAALMIAIGAFIAIKAAVDAHNKSILENAENTQKAYEETKKLTEETENLNDETQDLIQTFIQQKNAGENIADTYENLTKKLESIRENYKKLGVSDTTIDLLKQAESIGIVTNKWEKYINAQEKANKEAEEKTGSQAVSNIESSFAAAKIAFKKGQGQEHGNTLTRGVGAAGTDKTVSKILQDYQDIITDISGDDGTLTLSTRNSQEFYRDYQRLGELVHEIERAGKTNVDTYRELKLEFDAMSEYAKNIENSLDDASKFKINEALNKVGINPEEVYTLDQYIYTVQQITKETRGYFGSAEEAEKKARSFLNIFGNSSEAAATFDFLDKFNNKLSTAIELKEVTKEADTYITEYGKSAKTNYITTQEIGLKYNKESAKEEYEKMRQYLASLSEEQLELAINVNLDYIDSVEEFKNALNKIQDFEKEVKVIIDPQETINSAKTIRDNLSDVMKTFSEQGYLNTTQAIDFINQYPQYANYLTKIANGYAMSHEAINKFNGALQEEKKALKELIEPTNIGGKSLYDFGKNLIAIENSIENQKLKDFIVSIEDLTTSFINGEIEEEEFFNSFNANLSNININDLNQLDIMNYTNNIIPEMTNGIIAYSNAMTDAFDNGKISAEEYRNSIRNTADTVLTLVKNNQKMILASDDFKDSIEQVNGEFKAKGINRYNDQIKSMVENLNNSTKKMNKLQDALNDLNDFEPINLTVTEDYDDLQELFDEDFTIEIDTDQLDEAIQKTQDFRDNLVLAFSSLSKEAQENVIDKILTIGDSLDTTGQEAYNFQTNMDTAFSGVANGAARADTSVEQAAIDMLNGTYNSSVNSTELTANAMGLILKSGADTSALTSQLIGDVISDMGKLIDNFDAKISFAPTIGDLVEVGKIPILDIPIKIPSFGIAIKGRFTGDTNSIAKDLISKVGSLAQMNLSSSSGTMSSFKPKSTAGSPNNVQLDSPSNTKGSSGGKGGSGGGKSGSSSKPETADLKNLDEEITRYKNIDNQLDSIENHLDKISHKKDQAYGKKYIDALYEENEALQKQIDLHKQSQSDAIKYQAWDKQKVAELGFNIETDDAGYITNEEQFEAWIAQSENAIELEYTNSVNALGEDSNDQKNALEEQKQDQLDNIEAAKTYFDLYKEATERRYEDESDIEELLAQQRENNFDAINHKFEVQMDLLDREEKQIEHLRKTFREGLFGLADNTNADNSLIGKNLNLLDKIEDKKKALDEAFSTGAISKSQYIEGMQAIDDEVGEVYDSIIDLSDAIGDRFIEALNEADEIMDKSISKFGHLRTIMNSVENLIKLTYGEEDFNALGDVYENIAYASEKELKYNREMFEERKKTMDEARRQYNEALAGNIPEGKTLDQLKENLEEAENSVREWQEKMYSSAEAFAEDIINVYQNRVNKAMKQFEADLTGGSTFDQMKKELEMLQATDTDYLTGVNQQYETQKMIRTATNALESASNKMAKEKLNLFIEETKELQKKDKLSEYELGLQQRKYEIALAEIALQEAQNNKSQVRLQKDSEGNFNYVYTANEDKVAEAQQQYEDAQNDLYNYAREKENEIQQARLENWEAYWNEVNELSLDQTLNEEDRAVKLAEIRSRYLQRDVELTEQSNLTKEYSNQSYRDSYTINIADQIATTNEAKVAQKQASAEVIDANEELKEKTHEYTDLMNQDYIEVKDNADNYAINVENDMARTGDALEAVQAQTSVWANAMTTLLDNVAGRYNNLSNACQNAMETISGFFADTDYSLMWQNAQSLDEARYAVSTRRFMVDNNIAGKGIYAQNEEGLNTYDIWNQSQMIASSSTPEEAIRHAYLRIAKVEDAPGLYENMESTLEVLKEKFQREGWDESLFDHIKSEASRFDTGGYTGEFGPEGKFAMLHEKELVLNQQDTQNLLDTIDIVDKLLNSLEYQNLLQDFNISNIGNGINKDKDTLEQDVTIHAEFPNVQDHNEIEMALSNLVNTASQYANRKKS